MDGPRPETYCFGGEFEQLAPFSKSVQSDLPKFDSVRNKKTTEISHINVQYSKTIGRGEQFGPGFTYPYSWAPGKEGIMYVLCRGTEFRPEGVRVVVCTTDEEYVSVFARGKRLPGPSRAQYG
ncbi:MAG: hypothetical protein CM1200mP27_10560 [Chloroflexota bacterium]|nr:MAG: hypothetical protein CM1200mP27_10560 [Chloroflexota bacterium]